MVVDVCARSLQLKIATLGIAGNMKEGSRYDSGLRQMTPPDFTL